MPYTRNTRIKKIEHKHSVEFIAEVEYKYPILGITQWEEIDEVETSLFHHLVMKGNPLPFEAASNCWARNELDEIKGLEWAKTLIDEYHKLYDEEEFEPVVSYIKYP